MAFPAHTVEPSHGYNCAFRRSWLNTHTVLCCIHGFSSTYSGSFSRIQLCFLDQIKYLYHTLSSNNHSSGTSHCNVSGHRLRRFKNQTCSAFAWKSKLSQKVFSQIHVAVTIKIAIKTSWNYHITFDTDVVNAPGILVIVCFGVWILDFMPANITSFPSTRSEFCRPFQSLVLQVLQLLYGP